jgi:hypothetical protein
MINPVINTTTDFFSDEEERMKHCLMTEGDQQRGLITDFDLIHGQRFEMT